MDIAFVSNFPSAAEPSLRFVRRFLSPLAVPNGTGRSFTHLHSGPALHLTARETPSLRSGAILAFSPPTLSIPLKRYSDQSNPKEKPI